MPVYVDQHLNTSRLPLKSDNLKKLKIKLPVLQINEGKFYIDKEKKYSDEGYVPDWKFMEGYMKTIEDKAQHRIDLLSIIGK